MAQPTTTIFMHVEKKKGKKEGQEEKRLAQAAHDVKFEADILRKITAGNLSMACFQAGGRELPNGHPDLPKETLLGAVINGWMQVAAAMLDAGADPNASDMHGTTTLMYAAMWGYEELTLRLLRQGADPQATDRDGAGALMQCDTGNAAIARALLEAGAKVNAQDIYGLTPLIQAAQMGHKDLVKELLAWGADPHAVASDGAMAFDAPRRFRSIHGMLGAAGPGPFKGARRLLFTLFPVQGPRLAAAGGECWC